MSVVDYEAVIHFWFEQSTPKDWFTKNNDYDKKITEQFLKTYYAATNSELYHWRTNAQGRLAEIILLDQFSRNMFRNSAEAFKFDNMAVVLSQEAIELGEDKNLSIQMRKFIYMPLMHSESLVVHKLAIKVFSQPGLEDNYQYELRHKEIIEKFGRYPHRNQLLGRPSSKEEIDFLKQPGSSF
jgi:uncharacterized protein (DUF924 family)